MLHLRYPQAPGVTLPNQSKIARSCIKESRELSAIGCSNLFYIASFSGNGAERSHRCAGSGKRSGEVRQCEKPRIPAISERRRVRLACAPGARSWRVRTSLPYRSDLFSEVHFEECASLGLIGSEAALFSEMNTVWWASPAPLAAPDNSFAFIRRKRSDRWRRRTALVRAQI